MQRIGEMIPSVTSTPPSTTPRIAEQFSSTVQSPQFQQALSSFSAALQSGQLGPLVQQFGLPEECVAAANSASMLRNSFNFYFRIDFIIYRSRGLCQRTSKTD